MVRYEIIYIIRCILNRSRLSW